MLLDLINHGYMICDINSDEGGYLPTSFVLQGTDRSLSSIEVCGHV